MQKTILATLFVPGLLFAQQNASFQERVDARSDAISGRLGLDITSQYFFRGLQQENQGIIAQPRLDLAMNVYDGDSGLRNLSVVTGVMESLHSGPTGSTGGIWYESQFHIGVDGRFGERFRGGIRYATFSSPNGSAVALARPVQELQFHVGFDDAGVMGNFSLNPRAMVAIEMVGQRDAGADRGIYAEIGVAPTLELQEMGDGNMTLSFPVRLGLSLGDYYERPTIGGGGDDFFGFIQGGGVLTMPLNFLPESMGPWTGHCGLHALILGNNADRRNGGDEFEIFFEFGMATQF